MTHDLVIAPETADERTFAAGRITRASFGKNPSAIGSWRASIAGIDFSLEDLASSEIHLRRDGSLVFRGFLHTVQNTEASGDTSIDLSGAGIEYDLTRDQTTKTFSNVTVHDAIEEVWGETTFSASVTPPQPNQTISDEQAQEANTTSEFNTTFDIADTDPLEVTGDSINVLQSAFTEGRVVTNRADVGGTGFQLQTSDTDATYEESVSLEDSGDFVEYDFTIDYDIPEGDDHFLLWARERAENNANDPPSINYYLDGSLVSGDDSFSDTYTWEQHFPTDQAPLSSGTHTIRFEVFSGGTDPWRIDTLSPLDGRFNYTIQDALDSNGHLPGPELYPDAFTLASNLVEETWSINEGTLTTTWDNTENGQRIQLRLNDTGTWFPNDGTEENTASVTTGFGTEEGSAIQGRATWSRYGTTRTDETPTGGYNGQTLNSWEITWDGDDVPVFNQRTVEGSYFDILNRLHDRGRMHWWVDHAADSKNAFSAEADGVMRQLGDVTVKGHTQTTDLTDYYNHVTVRGTESGGTRFTATEPDSTPTQEITDWGKQHLDYGPDPELDSQAAVDIEARTLLAEKLSNRETTGELEIVAENFSAGPTFDDVDFGNGVTSAMLEEIRYFVAAGELRATLNFRIDPVDLGEQIAGLHTGLGTARRGF